VKTLAESPQVRAHLPGRCLRLHLADLDDPPTSGTVTPRRAAALSLHWGMFTSWRKRLASRSVIAPPHHSTTSWITDPSRPGVAQRPGPGHRVQQARSAQRPPNLQAGGPGRHVSSAVPPGHPKLSAATPASPTADSSHPLIDSGPSLSCKQLPTTGGSPPTISTCFTYP
jgi:hypothetical protein